MKNYLYFFLLGTVLIGCGQKELGKGFNLFTVQQDKELGAQVAQEIASKPKEFPVLDSLQYPKAYQLLYRMRDEILNAGNVRYKDEFRWQLKIIHDDSTLNAFCTPGGYIYVYTGLIKYLNAEDQLIGVLGHEIAHADFRHSTRQMTRMVGVSVLVSAITGNREALAQVTTALIGLRFSRNHETEADIGSVHYLCPTDYNAAGGAEFFKKLQELGGARPPEFLSTHPNPTDRIETFYNEKLERGCGGEENYEERYRDFINALP
jgi:predicted Zn-dependent protease